MAQSLWQDKDGSGLLRKEVICFSTVIGDTQDIDFIIHDNLQSSRAVNLPPFAKQLYAHKNSNGTHLSLFTAISQYVFGVEDETLADLTVTTLQKNQLFYQNFQQQGLRGSWNDFTAVLINNNTQLTAYHVFVVCNILRRPIIVFAKRCNFTDVGGLYLPIFTPPENCEKSPIVLGFDNYFVALLNSLNNIGSAPVNEEAQYVVPLPLATEPRFLLPCQGNSAGVIDNYLDSYEENNLIIVNLELKPCTNRGVHLPPINSKPTTEIYAKEGVTKSNKPIVSPNNMQCSSCPNKITAQDCENTDQNDLCTKCFINHLKRSTSVDKLFFTPSSVAEKSEVDELSFLPEIPPPPAIDFPTIPDPPPLEDYKTPPVLLGRGTIQRSNRYAECQNALNRSFENRSKSPPQQHALNESFENLSMGQRPTLNRSFASSPPPTPQTHLANSVTDYPVVAASARLPTPPVKLSPFDYDYDRSKVLCEVAGCMEVICANHKTRCAEHSGTAKECLMEKCNNPASQENEVGLCKNCVEEQINSVESEYEVINKVPNIPKYEVINPLPLNDDRLFFEALPPTPVEEQFVIPPWPNEIKIQLPRQTCMDCGKESTAYLCEECQSRQMKHMDVFQSEKQPLNPPRTMQAYPGEEEDFFNYLPPPPSNNNPFLVQEIPLNQGGEIPLEGLFDPNMIHLEKQVPRSQPLNQPVSCATEGCDFFGTRETFGLCSGCFKKKSIAESTQFQQLFENDYINADHMSAPVSLSDPERFQYDSYNENNSSDISQYLFS